MKDLWVRNLGLLHISFDCLSLHLFISRFISLDEVIMSKYHFDWIFDQAFGEKRESIIVSVFCSKRFSINGFQSLSASLAFKSRLESPRQLIDLSHAGTRSRKRVIQIGVSYEKPRSRSCSYRLQSKRIHVHTELFPSVFSLQRIFRKTENKPI